MILPLTQSGRCHDLLNTLTLYADRRLRVVPRNEFYSIAPDHPIDETAQRETLQELWKHPEIIDDFVRENPFNLKQSDLDVAASWKGCGMGDYFVDTVNIDGSKTLCFCTGGHAFVVHGISRHIESMLTQVPALVQTTLLPFEDKITYGMFIMEIPAEIGDNMRKVLSDELQTSVAEGRVVRTGAQFLETMPAIRAEAERRRLEKFRQDLEMEERAQGPLPGQHRGELAGMDEDERERRIRKHMREVMGEGGFDFRPKETLDSYSIPGDPVYTLEKLLQRDTLPEPATPSDQPDEVGDTDNEYYLGLVDPKLLQADLRCFSELEIEHLRELAARDGRWQIPTENLTTLKGLPRPTRGLCYYFHDGDDYLAVMPKEIVTAAKLVDWDEAIAHARKRRELLHFMETIVELRGILTLDEAFDAYRAACPQGFTSSFEVLNMVYEGLDSFEMGGCMLDTEDESYLMHFELFYDYLNSHGIRPRDVNSYYEGELDGLPEAILKHQRGKEARVLTPEMLASDSIFIWASEQPPSLAMRNYLDAHVPDDADDCFFADKVIEDLLTEVFIGFFQTGAQVFFDILEDNGFIPDYSQVNQLLGLWQNMCNGLPNWPNNGWSPNELHKRSSTRAIFYNEDGSPMRVGRNDPCPCGSGKKYKRCCGR